MVPALTAPDSISAHYASTICPSAIRKISAMGAVADFPVAGRGPKSPRRVALMVPRHRPRSAVPKWSSMVKRTSGIAWKIAEKKALISKRPRAVPPRGNGVVVHRVWGVELVYWIRGAAVDDFLHVSPGEVCCCALRHVVP